MLILIKCRSGSQLGHVGSKTRSLGQLLEKKPCVHFRGQSFDSKFIKLCQNVNPYKRTRVDKRVFWPQYFRKIEYVCLIGFLLT